MFNAHTGSVSQVTGLDDFTAADFDPVSHALVGGISHSVGDQRLPIQISREGLPRNVPRWGKGYKDHIRLW